MGYKIGDMITVTGKKSRLNPNLDPVHRFLHNKSFAIIDIRNDWNGFIQYYIKPPQHGVIYLMEDEIILATREELLGD